MPCSSPWQVFDAVRPIPTPGFFPKLDDQPGLLAVIHLRDTSTKQDHTRVAAATAGHLFSVHRHGSTVEGNKDQTLLAEYLQRNRVFGDAMLSAHPVGQVDDGQFLLQTKTGLHKVPRQIGVCHQADHSPASACRCTAISSGYCLA